MAQQIKKTEMMANVDEKLRITIPSVLSKKYGLRPGSKMFVTGTAKGIELWMQNPPRKISDSLYIVAGLGSSYQWDAVSYLIKGGSHAYLIDCGTDVGFAQITENIKKFGVEPSNISKIVLTHCHYDHSAGGGLFRKKYGTKVVAHELAQNPIESGDRERTASFIFGRGFPAYEINETVKHGQEISLGNIKLKTIHLPGHCPDNTGFYGNIDGKKVCFIGDICGAHSHRFKSSVKETLASIQKLLTLKIDILCHGHSYFTSEKAIHAALETWKVMCEDGVFAYWLARYRSFY